MSGHFSRLQAGQEYFMHSVCGATGGKLVVNVINPCEAGVVIDYPPAVCGRYTMGLQIEAWILLPNGPSAMCHEFYYPMAQ